MFRGKLTPSGLVPPEVREIFDSGIHRGLSYAGPISKREVAGFYRDMDALLLILAPGKFVTGGKTAEYLATGLPIVSIHDLESAATAMLKDYPLWFPAKDLSTESIAAALADCAKELADPDPKLWADAWDYGQQFERTASLRPAINELRSLIGTSNSAGDANTKGVTS